MMESGWTAAALGSLTVEMGLAENTNRLLQSHTRLALRAGHALGRLGVGCAACRITRLRRRVLGRALGLQCLGVKYAVLPEAAFRQRLGIVLERIRRGLGACIAHRQAQ